MRHKRNLSKAALRRVKNWREYVDYIDKKLSRRIVKKPPYKPKVYPVPLSWKRGSVKLQAKRLEESVELHNKQSLAELKKHMEEHVKNESE